jgi:hypothetical protein
VAALIIDVAVNALINLAIRFAMIDDRDVHAVLESIAE